MRPSISVLPEANSDTTPGPEMKPISAVADEATIHSGVNSSPGAVKWKNVSGSVSCSPRNPPTAASPNGSSNSDMTTMSGPWSDSVTTVARNPPAKPYTTKITVITKIAQLTLIVPPVIESKITDVLLRTSPIAMLIFSTPVSA